MKSYTLDDCEAPIKPAFIEKLSEKLNERPATMNMPGQSTSSHVFTMDEAYVHPLKVAYKYDETRLEDIELPSILNLSSILTKI